MRRSEEVDALWRKYKETEDLELRNALVEEYLNLVTFLAKRIAERLPRFLTLDEIQSAGVFGLIEAVQGFDLSRGVKFETYCSVRVRGAILDELRARDWAPRLVRIRVQKLWNALRRLETKLGRKASYPEILEELNLTPEELEALQTDNARLQIYSLNQGNEGDEEAIQSAQAANTADSRIPSPEETLQHKMAVQIIMDELTEKERHIIRLYYFKNLTMKEIAWLINLSESRVCQIHGGVLDRIRDELGHLREDLYDPAA